MPRGTSIYGPPPCVIGARIRAERERLGLSLKGAASMLGMKTAGLRNLERFANPQLSRLISLHEVLGYDVRNIAPELFTNGGNAGG